MGGQNFQKEETHDNFDIQIRPLLKVYGSAHPVALTFGSKKKKKFF